MQSEKILTLLKEYKAHIKDNGLSDELYKWQLLYSFQGRPDLTAPDFEAEMKNINYGNLMFHSAKAVIYHLSRDRKSEYVELLKDLFDETINLKSRVPVFMQSIENLYREIVPETRYANHHDERTISTLLTYKNPNEYTFFKDSFYKKYCNLLEVKPQKVGMKLPHYFELIDELVEDYIKKDDELISLFKSIVDGDVFLDENYKILAQDILYQSLDKSFGDNRNFWRVGTKDDDGSYWNEMLRGDQISIGWTNIGDLAEQNVKSKQDIINIFTRLGDYNDKKGVRTRKSGEIFDFYYSAKIGDIVLAQDGHTVLGIGEIIDNYNFLPYEHFPHQRRVKWFVTRFKPPFYSSEANLTSFVKLTDPALKETIKNYISNQKKHHEKLREMLIPKNQILYGPPGTGKTYHTTNLALEICGVDTKDIDRIEAKRQFDELSKQGRIVFTTFHQSMSYEDFIEGIKPIEPEKEGDQVIYKVEDGIFKKLCVEAAFSIATESESKQTETVLDFSLAYDELVNDIIDQFNEDKEFELDSKNGGKVLVDNISANGNIMIKHHGGTRTYTVSKKRSLRLHDAIDDLNSVNNIHDQFRAIIGGSNSSAYWSVLNAIQKKLNHKVPQKKTDRKYEYEEMKGVVQTIRNEDYKDKTGKPFILVIDEINRGNVSQIFGELITLIEDDKRLGKDEAIQVTLPYSKDEKFGVPSNLFIIGTMNTADRSVEALDTALRRRFSFEEMPPKPELLKTPNDLKNAGINLEELLTTINKRIEKLIDRDHRIGHSYFINVKDFYQLKSTFHNKIIPLLQEYFFGDYGKIGLVLGRGFVSEIENSDNEDLFAEFEYDSDGLMERKVYQLHNVSALKIEEFINCVKAIHRN